MPERDVEVLRVAAGVPAHVLHLHQRVHAREARGRDRRDVAEDVVRDRHLDRLLGRLVAKERPLELQEPGGNCIKIGLPGKSILRDYFLENRSSRRPFLLLRISFPGRRIFIQFIPVFVEARPHRDLDRATCAAVAAQGFPRGGVSLSREFGLAVGGVLLRGRSGRAFSGVAKSLVTFLPSK